MAADLGNTDGNIGRRGFVEAVNRVEWAAAGNEPERSMADKEDAELDRALAALMAQAEKEPVSPRLRELARRLEAALAEARNAQKAENEGTR